MTSKRKNSGVSEEERSPRQQGQSSAMASLNTSCRTSRTPSYEDMHSAVADVPASWRYTDKGKSDTNGYETGSTTSSGGVTVADERIIRDFTSEDDRVTAAMGPNSSSMAEQGRLGNFGIVLPGVYRSSYPLTEHFDFCQSLGLRTVVTLVNKEDERSVNLGAFVQSNGIRHVIFNMQGTKKEDIPQHTMQAILGVVLDKSCYPLLVHCNQGKHRTGCVVAAARKVSGWPVDTVLEEYRSFAEPKVRECDVQYITALEAAALEIRASKPISAPWIPSRFTPTKRRQFIRFIAFTVGTMVLFLCSSWQFSVK